METYHQKKYEQLGIGTHFVQDNLSYSVRGTLRGLHYQYPYGQAKLVQAIRGEIFDVIVDIRWGSPTFGQWAGISLSDENKRQFYVPEGFAHGFCVLSDTALGLRLPPKKERDIVCVFWYTMAHGNYKHDSGTVGECRREGTGQGVAQRQQGQRAGSTGAPCV
jgi:dTDP-4-dehydrorhamnose 3,5-epimerase-like enzyme